MTGYPSILQIRFLGACAAEDGDDALADDCEDYAYFAERLWVSPSVYDRVLAGWARPGMVDRVHRKMVAYGAGVTP